MNELKRLVAFSEENNFEILSTVIKEMNKVYAKKKRIKSKLAGRIEMLTTANRDLTHDNNLKDLRIKHLSEQLNFQNGLYSNISGSYESLKKQKDHMDNLVKKITKKS